jgi:mannose-1-phosphate guanylyltransferase/mannose-1-phosphate guanylyltransferase/mannose-6-phosphate isomerase
MVDHVFILAGGSGTRLWPASTQDNPKQFLKLSGDKSLLTLTIERARGLDISGEIVIITLEDQLDGILEECSSLEKGITVIPEPFARNTGPALALGTRYVASKYSREDSILVLAADHLITPQAQFAADVKKAADLAEEGMLVTFGIPPTFASTGYGYIEEGRPLGPGAKVASFREKPDRKTAEEFLERGNYSWNSGMFLFSAGLFLEEIEKYEPKISEAFADLGDFSETHSGNALIACRDEAVRKGYEKAPKISVDYAVMERSDKVGVIKAAFDWNDIGSWDEVAALGTAGTGEVFRVDSEGSYVYSDTPVALCGVDDLIVVVKNGRVLVCRKGETQKVKEIVNMLKEKERGDLL